ncbi:MAG: homoserine O-acetyltransferase [Planctomycetota bacterium]
MSTQFATIATIDAPMTLRNRATLGPVQLAYETWGTLAPGRNNAVLVFHALTGSHHAAGHDPHGPGSADAPWPWWTEEYHTGWWDDFIGPGKAIDTDHWFVICANYLGGCYGSTGPNSLHPDGTPWGSRFPWVTVSDVVDSQVALLDQLGIQRLRAAIGGSVGGFCAADLALRYPHRVEVVIPVASGLSATPLSRAHNIEQIAAIEFDPDFRGGDYYAGNPPTRGLLLARMIGHKSFVSLGKMKGRARAQVHPAPELASYKLQDPSESYLFHQARKFVPRFDANSYLRIMHMWQAFDLARQEGGGDAVAALRGVPHQRWLLFSIDSDECFPREEQAAMNAALEAAGVPVLWITVHSDKGHDSFLLDAPLYAPHYRKALERG